MNTPSDSDGSSQPERPQPRPSLTMRLAILGTALTIAMLLVAWAVLMMPSRWSPWLQTELTAQSGYDISWTRFSWRGVGGFQLDNVSVKAPDGSVDLKIPSIPLSWSFSLSQHPSIRLNSFNIEGIEAQLVQRPVDTAPPKAEPAIRQFDAAEDYEAFIQSKILEVRALVSLLDELPFTLVLDSSELQFSKIHYRDVAGDIDAACSDLGANLGFLLSPKSQRRRFNFEFRFPETCHVGSDTVTFNGALRLAGSVDGLSLELVNESTLRFDGTDYGLKLASDLRLLNDFTLLEYSLPTLKVDDFLTVNAGFRLNGRSPLTTSIDPMTLIVDFDSLPEIVRLQLQEQQAAIQEGILRASLEFEPFALSEFLINPLQVIQMSSTVSLDGLSVSHDQGSIQGVNARHKARLASGRLTTDFKIGIDRIKVFNPQTLIQGFEVEGADDILLTAFHGQSIEVINPGEYRIRVASMTNPEAELRRLETTVAPQVGILGTQPQWLLAGPTLRLGEIAHEKAQVAELRATVELKHSIPRQRTVVGAAWTLDSITLLQPVETLSTADLKDLSGSAKLQWDGRRHTAELESFTQSFSDWGQLTFEPTVASLAPDRPPSSTGGLSLRWSSIPEFADSVLATMDVTMAGAGALNLKWDGTQPSMAELPTAACKLEVLSSLIRPEEPAFKIVGNAELTDLTISKPNLDIRGGNFQTDFQFDVQNGLVLKLDSEVQKASFESKVVETFEFNTAATLSINDIEIEHTLRFDSFKDGEISSLGGHRELSKLSYHFDTSQIEGHFSVENEEPRVESLARFSGDAFGSWLCNGGILRGKFRGLPQLASSLELKIGAPGKVLKVGERELHGTMTMSGEVITQEKQIDLTGVTNFFDNELKDPNFHAKGVSGRLPVSQQVLLDQRRDDCLILAALPSRFCMIVGKESSVSTSVNREPTIRIAALTSQDLTIKRMSAEASYSTGWFGLRDYSAEFLDGDLRGDIYFGVTDDRGFDSRFSLKVTDLQLSRLLPKRFRRGKRTRANFVFDAGLTLKPGVSDLVLDLAVTRLEADALDALLSAMEQKTGLEQVSQAKSNLGWINFRGMNVWIRHEGLNVELDYDPIIIGYRPIPRSLMKRYSLRDWIFEPIIEKQMVPVLRDVLSWESKHAANMDMP